MVSMAKARLGRWFWPAAVVAALGLDYLVGAALLHTPPEQWSAVRRTYARLAHGAGQGYMLVLLAGVLVALAQVVQRRRLLSAGRWLVGIVLMTGFWAQFLKHLVGRPRPRIWAQFDTVLPLGPTFRASWDSFPSGHAMTVFAAVPLLEALCPAVGPLWLILAVAIALGRVIGCDHFPTDVVVGAWLGLTIGRYARGRWQAEVEGCDEHV